MNALTHAETARLAELNAERDKLLAKARIADAYDLCLRVKAIAEFWSVRNFAKVCADDLGIKDLSPLLKDLGLSNADEFNAYVAGLG